MRQYHDLLQRILDEGVKQGRPHRHGHAVGLRPPDAVRPAQGFPLVTTKKLHLKSIVHELLWFLAGDTNVAYLKDNGVSIWDEWADEQRRARPGLRQAMALVGEARTGARTTRLQVAARRDHAQSRLAPSRAVGLERRRSRQDGARAVPLPVPVLRRGRQALVPALPALGRLLPRRAVQHRELRAADAYGRAGERAGARRFRAHVRRRASLSQSSRADATCNCRASRARCRRCGSIRTCARSSTSPSTTSSFDDYDPHPHIKAPVAV